MNRLVTLFAFAALVTAPLATRAADSVYTEPRIDKCENRLTEPSQEDIEHGNVALKCPGYKDYSFYFDESEDRQSVYFGHLSQDIVELGGETFEVVNHIDGKVEWRLDANGVPRATILRYVMETFDAETLQRAAADGEVRRNGEILVVSRVGQPGDQTGCVTAYIDALANGDATEMARKLADQQSPTFPCGRERPRFHGKVGEWVGQPIYDYPELTETK